MAFKNLTNPKTIMNLGPNRSILGTIIRPDPVLLERKGGLNGDVTFDSLLPGAGEPLQQEFGEKDMLCNWQLDYEEDPLPRGVDTSAEPSTPSTKKRKSSKKSNKKLKENGDLKVARSEEKDSRKENKRKRYKKEKEEKNTPR